VPEQQDAFNLASIYSMWVSCCNHTYHLLGFDVFCVWLEEVNLA